MARKRKLTPTVADRSEMLALLDAAKDDPFDLSRRLVLADWLEEHGGESDRARAQVIRLQIESANGGIPWVGRVAKIRDKYVREWMTPAHRAMFRAGYPACEAGLLCVATAPRNWPADGVADEAWRWVETARFASLRSAEDVSAVVASPPAATVAEIDAGYPAAPVAVLRPLLQGAAARRLAFSTTAADLEEIAGLLRPGLTSLSVNVAGGAEARAWAALLSSDVVAGLRSLRLVCTSPPAEAERLAGLSELRHLSLPLGDALPVSCPPSLRSIRSDVFAALDTPARLADLPCAETLEHVSLILDARGKALPFHFPNLRRLALYHGLEPASAARFAAAGVFAGPTWLDLSQNPRLGPKGLAAIFASLPTGPPLLDLSWCALDKKSVAPLAAWPGLAGVRVLNLSHNRLTDAAVRALASSPYAAGLEALSLVRNEDLTAEGAADLMASPLGRNLRWLASDRLVGWQEPIIDETTRLREYVATG